MNSPWMKHKMPPIVKKRRLDIAQVCLDLLELVNVPKMSIENATANVILQSANEFCSILIVSKRLELKS